MRMVRFGALLMLSLLAGCAAEPRYSVATIPAPAVDERTLVATPAPALVVEPPLPALKPGTEMSLAESEALAEQASPKGPPVEGDPTASQKAMGRMVGQPMAPAGATAGAETAGPEAAGPEAAGAEAATGQQAWLTPGGGTSAPSVTTAAQLVGLSQSDATRLFGLPAESKDLPPSKIWTYHSPVCDMKLFFYPEVGGANFRALTYQIDERGAFDATHNACLSSLAKPHAG